ncbi:hypothetical protein LTR27_006081 [Elasticomyces elasticus]|nr:hypothetical protein LTR27_006081 [Elasticomyces elasticus]
MRRLTVEPQSKQHSPHDSQGAELAHLLTRLPKDKLEHFSVDAMNPISHDIAFVLRLRQRKLTNLVLYDAPPTIDYLPDIDELRNVTALSFHLSSIKDSTRAAAVLRNAGSVSSIALYKPQLLVQPGKATSDEVLKSLFSDWQSDRGPALPGLKRLYFKAFQFPKCGEVVTAAVDSAQLRELVLVHCWDTNMLLEPLAQKGFAPTLLTDDSSIHDTDPPGVLETLLQSYRGLETLRLTVHEETAFQDDCGWTAIQHHASTLRTLFVDDFFGEVTPFEDTFQDRSISALRKLLDRGPPPDLPHEAFTEFLGCLKPLVDLRTLRIFVYLNQLKGVRREDDELYDTEDELLALKAENFVGNLASLVFYNLFDHCPQLKALVIDARHPADGQGFGDACLQRSFTRVVQRDLYGRAAAAAKPCERTAIKLHEPYADVLEDRVFFDNSL